MNITQQVSINTSADKVWDILGNDFPNITKWAVRMLASAGDKELGPIGGRQVTTVEYGNAAETLYKFDSERRELAYSLSGETLPPILSDITTTWRIEPNGENQSVVTNIFEAKLLNPEMEEMIKTQFMQGLTPLFEELKFYAENGQPHPRKIDQLATK